MLSLSAVVRSLALTLIEFQFLQTLRRQEVSLRSFQKASFTMKISPSTIPVFITTVMSLTTYVSVGAQLLGALQVSDVEAAFGLAAGSVVI